jgi:hypothetical protein
MADEIRLPIQFAVNNAGFETTRVISGQSITQNLSGGGWVSGTVATSTGEGSISLSGMTKPGIAYFKNLSVTASENILLGTSTGQYDIQLNPDEAFVVRLNDGTASVFHKSDAGTPDLEYLILED